jgi:hypothetical protein
MGFRNSLVAREEKWYFDQQEHQHRRSLVEEGEQTDSPLPPTMPEVKVPDDAEIREESEKSPHWGRVKNFYTLVGQEQVSQQKMQEGVETLTELEKEGYSHTDLDAALEWIVKHRQLKFGGEVHSVRLVIKVIGQALREQKQKQHRLEREQQLALEEQASEFQTEDMEQKFMLLSVQVQDILRQKAVRNLLAQGYKEKFLLERIVKNEIYRLMIEKKDQ